MRVKIVSEFVYELSKNRMVPKCPVCGLSGLRRKRDAAFMASREYVTVQVSPLPLTEPRDAVTRRMQIAKYSISHHMIIKRFLLLGLAAEYRSRRWM